MPTDHTFNANKKEPSSQQNSEMYTSLIDNHAAQLVDDLFQDLESDLSGLTSPTARRSHSIIQTDRAQPKKSEPLSADAAAMLLSLPPVKDMVVPYVPFEEAFLELEKSEAVSQQSSQRLLAEGQEQSEGFSQRWMLSIGLTALVCSIGVWVSTALQHRNPVPTQAAASATQSQIPAMPQVSPSATTAPQVSEKGMMPPAAAIMASPLSVPLPTNTAQPVIKGVVSQEKAIAAIPKVQQPKPTTVTAAPKVAKPVTPAQPQRFSKAPPAAVVIPVKTVPTQVAAAAIPGNPVQQLPTLTPDAAPTALPMGKPAAKAQPAGITIQGILDFGDQSALLLARNGSTQQVRVGEALDSSGWRLLRVENGRGIIQRGSDIRTVEEGEKF
jgi:hypothetical protein